jgi:CHAT domain-containing protein
MAPQCRILHIATHGFTASARNESSEEAEPSNDFSDPEDRFDSRHHDDAIYNPELLSGLVFAGANNPPTLPSDLSALASLPDDGLLTAEEAALLSLGAVRLAVLSACDTGLGELAAGEGVLGVQRSFQIAGARSTIASLWKVNDLATRRIMEEFYRNCLQRELSPLDALRQAQLWALHHPDLVPRGNINELTKVPSFSIGEERLPPQFWAAFTLSGDWR